MMRVAALYDIHGNLPALEAVLREVRQAGADRIVVGGDVVSGPMPRETLAALLGFDQPVQFIQGNGEAELLAQMKGVDTGNVPAQYLPAVRWVAQQLSPDFESLLAGWPETLRLEIGGLGEALFCHATPRNNTEVFTRLTPEDRLRPVFAGVESPVVVCGHTHMQFDRTIGKIRVVNAGSVGMAYGAPGACWLLLGPTIQHRQTRYDLAGAAERIRATQYPLAEDFAAHNVLERPGEAEVLEAFTKMELK
jgi:predicted phosphodiesterase